jgi:hypothetical protein
LKIVFAVPKGHPQIGDNAANPLLPFAESKRHDSHILIVEFEAGRLYLASLVEVHVEDSDM